MSWFADMDWIDYSILLIILLMVSIAIGDYLEDILSWIKLQWKEAAPLKKIYIVVASIIGVALIYLFANLYSQIFVFLSNPTPENKIDSNFALAFLGTMTGGVALFSGFLAILRSEENTRQNEIANKQSKIADKQAKTAEQGLITDRINKATEGLGKFKDKGDPIVEVRLGALYALERIAQDSIRDHIQIMEMLCAYIRTNSPATDNNEKLREDILAAITIIARRGFSKSGKERVKEEKIHVCYIELNNCNLCNATFGNADMSDARLINSNLHEAYFDYTNLSDAWINNSNMSGAFFRKTDMENTETSGAYAYTGDFSECKNLIQKQVNQMFLGKNVDLPKGLTRPKHNTYYDKAYDTLEEFMEAYEKWKNAQP